VGDDDDDGTKRGGDAIDRLVCEALSGGAFAVRFGASRELRCASRSLVFLLCLDRLNGTRGGLLRAAHTNHQPARSLFPSLRRAVGSRNPARTSARDGNGTFRWQRGPHAPRPSVRALDGVLAVTAAEANTNTGRPAGRRLGPAVLSDLRSNGFGSRPASSSHRSNDHPTRYRHDHHHHHQPPMTTTPSSSYHRSPPPALGPRLPFQRAGYSGLTLALSADAQDGGWGQQ
jgi:hypothetical protein